MAKILVCDDDKDIVEAIDIYLTQEGYEVLKAYDGDEAIGADNTVAVHIRHIREKIEINPKEPRYLKVVWGVGYKVEKIG